MEAKNVFKKVLNDGIKNIIFYGVGAVVIAFIGNALGLRIIGLILAFGFVITVLISLVPFLIAFIAGLVGTVTAISSIVSGDKEAIKEHGYLWAGTLVQLVENAACLYYVLYLYRAFY